MSVRRLIREPLLHFLVLGAALFVLYGWANDDPSGASRPTIVVDENRIRLLDAQFQRVWRRPPSGPERQQLIDGWLREEILYREGVAMGLDQGDPVIRRRVAQKMAFISEDLSVTPPTREQLEAWLVSHADDYRHEPTVTFRQVLVSADADDRAPAIEQMVQSLQQGEPVEGMGVATLLPAAESDARLSRVARTFGDGFAAALQQAPLNVWHGPVPSPYGLHVVKVEMRSPGRRAELAEVRAAVERDYLNARSSEANRKLYDALRARYRVIVEPADVPLEG